MKQNKQYKNWWIDVLLMTGYLFCFYLDLTGIAGHQWLGAAMGVLAVIHLWLHKDWVAAVTKKLFARGYARNRWYYLLDLLIVVGFIVILETGLVISTWLKLTITNYVTWLDVHTYASFVTLDLIVVKVGMHWRWVVNITGRIFSSNSKPLPVVKHPANSSALVPVPVPIKTQDHREVVDRRRFLAMMGVVSLGSILAASNVLSENALLVVKESGSSGGNDTVSAAAESPTSTAASTSAQQAAVSQESAAVANATAEPASAATLAPTIEPTAQAVTSCSVRCPRGCSFPGSCRRYIDQNANSLCDLGECL